MQHLDKSKHIIHFAEAHTHSHTHNTPCIILCNYFINKQKSATAWKRSWGNRYEEIEGDARESEKVGRHKERVYNWKDVKNEVSVWSIEGKGHRSRSPNSAQSTLIRATNQILPGCPRPLLITGRGVHTHFHNISLSSPVLL